MTEEKLFEYARENKWDKIIKLINEFWEINHTSCSLGEIEAKIGRKIPDIEIRAMCSLGLTQIMKKEAGGYALVVTELGLKLLTN